MSFPRNDQHTERPRGARHGTETPGHAARQGVEGPDQPARRGGKRVAWLKPSARVGLDERTSAQHPPSAPRASRAAAHELEAVRWARAN